ncbi:MAG: alkaline phosphatase [Bryobacteraceae bacterium]|nr:alkaline phosphatase [Bryobacteraceae bacterium]
MKFRNVSAFLLLSVLCPGASHVILIGVDGLAPAGIRRAETPNFKQLMKRGSWTFHARAVIPTVSSPNWASMVNGAGPAQHGITSNEWKPEKHEIEPVCHGSTAIFPTIFDALRQQKATSRIGIFHHWEDFARLVERGAPNRIEHVKTADETMATAISWWKTQKPDLLFVHLDHVDDAGHNHGWSTPEYKAAVEKADALVGQMLSAVDASPERAETTLIVSSDHGGTGKKHGGLTMDEIEIPWFVVGPGVRAGFELKNPVNTYDTAATIARVLKVKTPPCWIGRPVAEAWTR